MSNLGPKKDGSPNIDFFQSPESLQGFETVRLWLTKNHKKVKMKIRRKQEKCLTFTKVKPTMKNVDFTQNYCKLASWM
jgi:hypothetical protein